MLKHVPQTLILAATVIAMTAAPRPATAGGVIIDGRTDDGLASGCPSDDEADDGSTAGSTMSQDFDGNTSVPLSEDEQEIFIFASVVFGGHDAVSKLSGEPGYSDDTTALIIDDFEGSDAQGGCAALPVSSLAALAALALLRRRRR